MRRNRYYEGRWNAKMKMSVEENDDMRENLTWRKMHYSDLSLMLVLNVEEYSAEEKQGMF